MIAISSAREGQDGRMAFRYSRFYAAANGMLNAAKEIVRRL